MFIVAVSSSSLSQSTKKKNTIFLKEIEKVSIILILLINNDVLMSGKKYTRKFLFFSVSNLASFGTRLNFKEIPETHFHGNITKTDKVISESNQFVNINFIFAQYLLNTHQGI